MTKRFEVEEIFEGFSIVDHSLASQSIVGEACYSGYSVRHGYTPLRQLPTAPTTQQLHDFIATMVGDLFKQR